MYGIDMEPYFSAPANVQLLTTAANSLIIGSPDSLKYRLGQALRIIANNAQTFEKSCEVNIEWMGGRFIVLVSEVRVHSSDSDLEQLVWMTYRVVRELQFSIKEDLSMELSSFVATVDQLHDNFRAETKAQINFAQTHMPVAVLKNLIHSNKYGPLTDLPSLAANAEKKIKEWKEDLEKAEERTTKIAETLSTQEQAFNFVGLNQGFSDLADSIRRELNFARLGLLAFGLLILIPSSIDLWLITLKNLDLSKVGNYTLGAALLSTITITLLFLYFFRIALRKADSCRAQLVQIRLRMSLCKFIQSYAGYSAEIKAKNSDALSKFEALIFSGIVGTEDKLPSTFDGIEQLSALAKSIRG
jgi:hypothetical protein